MYLNILLKSKKRWIIFVIITTILLFLIGIFLMIRQIDKIQNGSKFKGNLDLNFTNYYTEYDMTVISNKNVNTYNVKEWHKEGVITKLEYLDYMKNVVTIVLEGNICSITNSGNTARLMINNMYNNRNIASLSTFHHMYNSNKPECCCEKTKYVKEEEIIASINFKQGCTCGCKAMVDELGISKLELILVEGIPKNYIVYDKNKKEYISIVYNIYEKKY